MCDMISSCQIRKQPRDAPATRVFGRKEGHMARKETQSVKVLAERVGKAKGIDPEKAAKLVRGRIRGNFDTLATKANWPALVTQGKANKDGGRYPEMPVKTADAIFKAMTKGTPLADAIKDANKRAPKAPKADAPAPDAA